MMKGKRSAISRTEARSSSSSGLVTILTEEAREVVYMRGETKNHKGEDDNNAYTCEGYVRRLISTFRVTAAGGRD